jgi:lipoate-protein ligase B
MPPLSWKTAPMPFIAATRMNHLVSNTLLSAGTSAKLVDLVELTAFRSMLKRGGQYTYHGPGQQVAYVMLTWASAATTCAAL